LPKDSREYLLGVNTEELERLRFQHTVWKPTTDAFFERIGVAKGWRCLDVGAGPGLVTLDLAELVGTPGEVTGLEPSAFYLESLRSAAAKRSFQHVKTINGSAETAELPDKYFDLIFVRWVIGFTPDPSAFLSPLVHALKDGGTIAIQDYLYEGLSLFPRGGAFDGMSDVVRAYYKSVGGDPYIGANLPGLLRRLKLEVIDYSPQVLAGGPDSGVIEWAHRFFTVHIPLMVEKGIVEEERGTALLADWSKHRHDPETIFVSPIVIDIAARK